jgi:hypothetical protein
MNLPRRLHPAPLHPTGFQDIERIRFDGGRVQAQSGVTKPKGEAVTIME